MTKTKQKNTKETKTKTTTTGKLAKPILGSQRPTRTTTGKSQFGDRKWIYRGVSKVDKKSLKVEETVEKDFVAFPKDQAEKILAKALERNDIVKGRLWGKKAQNNVEMASIGLAFADDNGVVVAA